MVVYHIFYWVHIVSAIAWLAAFVASLFWVFKAWRARKTTKEKQYLRYERRATSIGAHFGATGIIISGPIIASVGISWGWFPFHVFTWLAIKQIVFIVIIILIILSVRQSMSFRRQIKKEGDLISQLARKKWRKAYAISFIVYLLVVLNTILGSTKPF